MNKEILGKDSEEFLGEDHRKRDLVGFEVVKKFRKDVVEQN